MVRNINKKVIKIILLLVVLLAVISVSNHCFAIGDVTEWTWEPTIESDTSLSEKAEPILGAIRVIGILVSVGSLSYIGIKIMIGSVEDKSNYKQKLVPWVIGATMVFAMTFIPTIIYEFSSNVSKTTHERGTYPQGNERFLNGFDQGISAADDILKSCKREDENVSANEIIKKIDEFIKTEELLLKYREDKNGYNGGMYRALKTITNRAEGKDVEGIAGLIKGCIDAKKAINEGTIRVDKSPNVEINATNIKGIYDYYISKGPTR